MKTDDTAATPATETAAPVAATEKKTRRPRKDKGVKKGKKAAPKPKKGAKKAKSANAGKVIEVKRSRDFKRIKRIGDKEHKVNLTHYKSVVSASGNSSLDNGDDVAGMLRGKDLDEVYRLTAKHTEVPETQLRHNYKHLNPGMQRMNLGNKLRAVLQEEGDE